MSFLDSPEFRGRMWLALFLCAPASLLYLKWWIEDRRAARAKRREGFDVIRKD